MVIGHSAFAVGRFLSAASCLVVKPRRILLFLFAGLIITSVFCMKLSGDSAVALVILVMFFEVFFPSFFIFSLTRSHRDANDLG